MAVVYPYDNTVFPLRVAAPVGQGAESDPIAFELQRKTGGMVYESVKQTWRIAQARLPGRVYYWELPSSCTCRAATTATRWSAPTASSCG